MAVEVRPTYFRLLDKIMVTGEFNFKEMIDYVLPQNIQNVFYLFMVCFIMTRWNYIHFNLKKQ